jgi:hypothetical protein
MMPRFIGYIGKNPESQNAYQRGVPLEQIPGIEDYIRTAADEALREPAGSGRHRLIFTRNGSQYTGVLAPGSLQYFIGDPFFGGHGVFYPAGATIFRLTRKDAHTYQGEILDITSNISGGQLVWRPTTIIVKGELMDQTGTEGPLYMERWRRNRHYYWVRKPGN